MYRRRTAQQICRQTTSKMFTAVKSFVTERKQGLVKVAGVVGGLYVARRYVVDRLEDAKERMEQERTAQDMYAFTLIQKTYQIDLDF